MAFALCCADVYSQHEKKITQNDSLKIPVPYKDSSKIQRISLRYDLNLFNPAGSLRYNADFSASKDVMSFVGKDSRMSDDFLSPLYSKYQYDQRMAPYYYILGVAQGAAVGYLLYEHISKYGIWDKKK
jgi:hypothetical protein